MASSAKQQKLDGFFIKKQTNNGINTDLTVAAGTQKTLKLLNCHPKQAFV